MALMCQLLCNFLLRVAATKEMVSHHLLWEICLVFVENFKIHPVLQPLSPPLDIWYLCQIEFEQRFALLKA
jgi:hypothetical protein